MSLCVKIGTLLVWPGETIIPAMLSYVLKVHLLRDPGERDRHFQRVKARHAELILRLTGLSLQRTGRFRKWYR